MSARTLLRGLAAATAAAATLTLSACGAVTPADSGGSEDGSFELASHIQQRIDDGEPMRIKLSYHDPSLAFATPIGAGMEKAGEELGADVALIGPTGGDAAQQVSEIQTLIQQKAVDGLAVSSASSDALKPVIAQAYDAGIPVISFNTDNPDSKQMGFVGQDLKGSGKAQAERLLEELDGTNEGKVVVFSVDTGAGWSHDRFGGFKEGLDGSGLEIVGPVNVGNEPSAAYNTVESTMSGQSGVVAVAGLDCCSTTAAAKWVAQSGDAGDIAMGGFDLLTRTAEYIDEGVLDFTISQNPAEQGYQAVKVLHDFLTEGTEIEGMDTGAQFITQDNLDEATVED
ncbi:sugar ABC transporter substrate-binding protein [Streptomyces radiopugnans]|uniref:Simple sugar transport system substrate-binding protein/ribose transport system substrate-binding protein n=1 Tax=Streptomyces radiopugnans TaxID=403935 RepID=A0A1H9B6Z1_9ACTN|nr:substrate-binding domain-containing protein [Streptomyces radiopugnans]SEP84018.1 simple sugar transport system substrate-binding protein/ribose transport system substrate-binding protein [Streptomyces radiopugnans]